MAAVYWGLGVRPQPGVAGDLNRILREKAQWAVYSFIAVPPGHPDFVRIATQTGMEIDPAHRRYRFEMLPVGPASVRTPAAYTTSWWTSRKRQRPIPTADYSLSIAADHGNWTIQYRRSDCRRRASQQRGGDSLRQLAGCKYGFSSANGLHQRPGETLPSGASAGIENIKEIGSARLTIGLPGARHEGIWIDWNGARRFEQFGQDVQGAWRGFQVQRTAFDAMLLARAAEAGAFVRQPCAVSGLLMQDGVVRGVVMDGGPVAARAWSMRAAARNGCAANWGSAPRHVRRN